MNGGRFVGRVGGLAVALGVGFAFASGQSVAWAEDGSSTDTDAAAASSPAAGTSPQANTPSAPESASPGGDGKAAGESDDAESGDTDAGDPESGAPESTGDSGRHSSRRAATKPDRHEREVADTTTGVDADESPTNPGSTGSGRHSRVPGATVRRQQIDERVEPPHRAVAELAEPDPTSSAQSAPATEARPVTAETVAVQQISTRSDDAAGPEPTIGEAVVTMLAAAALGPLTSDDPATPVDSPVELALLAVGTRLRTSGEPTAGESAAALVAAELSDENNPEAMTFDVAALVTPNSAPTVPTQPIGVPDPVTGVVAGTVNASDADNNPLTYTVATGPAKGTVALNPATGAYTYTPTQLSRLAAGATAGPDTDSFTVAVGDGQQSTNATVSVYVSPLQYATSTSLKTGPAPSAVAVTTDGRMFVANTANWSVSVIDTATGKQIDAQPNNWFSNDIGVGPWPGALLLSPDGKRLYVANTGWLSVSVIDTTTYKAIDADPGNWFSNDIGVGFNPSAMTLGSDGRLYVANRGGASVSVIDTKTFKRIDTDPNNWFNNDIAVGSSPSALALNGTQLYVANRNSNTVSVIDTATYRVTKTLTVGKQPSAMALGANGRLYVVNTGANSVSIIDTTANTVGATTISVGPAPTSIALDPATNRAYVSNTNDTVSIVDTVTNTVLGTSVIDTDTTGGHSLTVGTNGTVYVADTNDNAVRVLALTRGNTAPIVGTPVVGTPDPGTGAVTVTLSFSDPDGDSLNWGWAAPSTGTLTDGGRSGDVHSFVFTPSQAARDAAAGGGPASTKITIDVSDNRASIPVNVTVPIAPTTGPTRLTVINGASLSWNAWTSSSLTLNPNGTRAVAIGLPAAGAASSGFSRVAVIDTATGWTVAGEFTLPGKLLSNPMFSADGTRALVTTSGPTFQATTINLATGAQTGHINYTDTQEFQLVDADFTRALITTPVENGTQVAMFDTTTGAQIGATLSLVGGSAQSTVLTGNSNRALIQATDDTGASPITRVAVVNTLTGAQIGTTLEVVGGGTVSVIQNTAGSRVLIQTADSTSTFVTVVDTLSGARVGTSVAHVGGGLTTVSDDWSHALINDVTLDPDTGTPTMRVTVVDTTTGTQVGTTYSLTGYRDLQLLTDDAGRALLSRKMWSTETPTVESITAVVIDTFTGAQIGDSFTFTGTDNDFWLAADRTRAVIRTVNVDAGTGESTTRVTVLNTATGNLIGSGLTLAGEWRRPGPWDYREFAGDGGHVTLISTGATPPTGYPPTLVAVIDTATGTQTGQTLRLDGEEVWGWRVVSADGNHLLTITQNYKILSDGYSYTVTYFTMIDTTTGTQIGSTMLAGTRNPTDDMTVDPDTGRVFAMTNGTSPGRAGYADFLAVIDTATGRQLGSTVSTAGGNSTLQISADHTTGLLQSRTQTVVFRTSDGTQVGTTVASTMSVASAISADGSHAAFLDASGNLYLNPLKVVILQLT